MSTTTLRCRLLGHRWFEPKTLNWVRASVGEQPVRLCQRCEQQEEWHPVFARRRPDDGRVVELLVGLVLVVALLGAVLIPIVREIGAAEHDLRDRICSSSLDARCTEVGP